MKTVLITGGSRGIGAACVREFARAGYTVAFTYRRAVEAAEALAREVGALALRADSADPAQVRQAVHTVLEHCGSIDVLINNAALSSFSLFTEITDDAWEEIFRVNVNGTFHYTKAVLPGMIARKSGSVLNISSMWGVTGASCEVHYSATKAAIIGMTKALAKEVGPSGIRVNCIAPGVIETDMNAALNEETRASLCEETPLCRIGRVEEVAAAALFLAGESASFITGQVLGVNGGILI